MTPTTLTARPLARLRPAESAQRSWRYALTGVVALFTSALGGCTAAQLDFAIGVLCGVLAGLAGACWFAAWVLRGSK